MNRPIEIVIDEIVLHGVEVRHADAVTGGMHARLEQLASGATEGWSDASADVLAARVVRAPAGSPTQLGVRVADSLWSSLARTGTVPR